MVEMESISATIPVVFKQTEIGEIPEDWKLKCLGELLSVMHGKSQKGIVDDSGRFPILGTGGIMGWTNDFLHDKPCVMIGRKGTIDKPQYMDTPFWSVDTLFYCIVKNKNNAKYIYYRFCQIDWYSYNEASGVPSLNSGTIEKIIIQIPGYKEQKAIAEVLTDSDSQIQALELLISKKRDIKQGTIQKLLTGKNRLPGFTGKWRECTLKEVGLLTMGQSPPGNSYSDNIRHSPLINGAVELTKRGIKINKYTNMPTRLSKVGDFIFCIRATIGNLQISDKIYCLGRGVSSLTPNNNYSKQFIYHALNNLFLQMKEKSEGGVIQGLKKEDLENFPLMVPESLEEQETIGVLLSDMDAEIAALEKRLEKAKAIKKGMMQQLLTGRIRLVDSSTPQEARV